MAGFKRKNPADLQKQLQELADRKNFEDAAEWKLSSDNLGNGSAIIRFLPAKNDDDVPFVKIFNHGFKDEKTGRWFVENCPTTLLNDCPVCSQNRDLWNSGIESNKKLASKRKRKLSYWANIVVIKDESNPDAVGNVYKFRFGQKIMDKIQGAANPDVELGEKPMDVTCVFEGANFLLKTKKVSGFANYDESKFGKSDELFGGDEAKLTEVWEKMHDLNPIVAPSEFLPEGELIKKFNAATGTSSAPVRSAADDLDELASSTDDAELSKIEPSKVNTADDGSTDELDDILADLDLN